MYILYFSHKIGQKLFLTSLDFKFHLIGKYINIFIFFNILNVKENYW